MKSPTVPPSPPCSLTAFEAQQVRPAAGRVLLVGSRVYEGRLDRRTRHADVLGVDMLPGPGVDRVLDLEDEPPADLGLFSHVECLSVLEHTRRPWLLAAHIERLMAPGATLFLAAPFVWRLHGYPSDYWRFTPDGVRALFPGIRWQALLLAGRELVEGHEVLIKSGFPYLARSQVAGFGVRA